MGEKRKRALFRCSSSSSKKKQKSLLFGGWCGLGLIGETMWFSFDLPDNDEKKPLIPVADSIRLLELFALNPELEPLFTRVNHSSPPTTLAPLAVADGTKNLLFSICIQLVSTVYGFGGNPTRPTRKVWCFEAPSLLHIEGIGDGAAGAGAGAGDIWKRAPSMRSRRAQNVRVVCLRGKLYVFGGNNSLPHFGEIFDPSNQTWTYLPPPPFSPNSLSHCVAHEASNKIIVSLSPRVFIYNADTSSWEDPKFPFNTTTPSLVGQRTIYFLRRSKLCAFDPYGEYTFHPCEITELKEEYAKNDNWIKPEPVLLPLDSDNLCIFWATSSGKPRKRKMCCRFLQIRVSQSAVESQHADKLSLYAITNSYRYYIVDYDLHILNTVLLDGSLGGEMCKATDSLGTTSD